MQNVFGESDRECSQQDLSEFVYLECCLKECLRMYSSAPHIERYVKEESQLGKRHFRSCEVVPILCGGNFSGEYLIPAGCTFILIMLYGIHHNPRLHEYIQIHGFSIRTGSYLSDCKGVTLTLIFRSALDLETALVNYS